MNGEKECKSLLLRFDEVERFIAAPHGKSKLLHS